jgi:hypothetical protein
MIVLNEQTNVKELILKDDHVLIQKNNNEYVKASFSQITWCSDDWYKKDELNTSPGFGAGRFNLIIKGVSGGANIVNR